MGKHVLERYLFEKGLTKKEFAEELDIDRNHLHSIISGRRQPSVKLAMKIEKLTGREILKEKLLFPEEYPAI